MPHKNTEGVISQSKNKKLYHLKTTMATPTLSPVADDSVSDGDMDSVTTISEKLEESGTPTGFSKSEEDTTALSKKASVHTYKPRPLTFEEKEKLVVEQAELLAFFTLLYSATALAIAVRLLTKDDQEEEFEKGVSLLQLQRGE